MEVTVIIPNYNGRHFMDTCLKSLERQSCKDFKTLIVDNCSTDGSLEYMRQKYPGIQVAALNKNYGFSHAVNVGIKMSRTPYVILLNNDTAVEKHFVEELVKAIKKSRRIFSVSSKMTQMNAPGLIDSAGDLYTIIGWGICRGSGRPVTNYRKPDSIFSACAGAAIYRRSVFQKIGYFDESHFAYLEDVDIGYRARIYGYKNSYCPTALVRHVGSGTSGSKYNAFKVRLSARNSIYLNYKNMPSLQLGLNLLPLAAGYGIKYLFFRKTGFAKEYREGLAEGLKTLHICKKVPVRMKFILNYVKIEWELVANTWSYGADWSKRKLDNITEVLRKC